VIRRITAAPKLSQRPSSVRAWAIIGTKLRQTRGLPLFGGYQSCRASDGIRGLENLLTIESYFSMSLCTVKMRAQGYAPYAAHICLIASESSEEIR
jgi:hypothetical protein